MTTDGKILWVDNDAARILGLVEYLEDSGFNIEINTSVKDSMRRMKEQDFALVILDVMMPHGDELSAEETKLGDETGIALARWIRRNFPKTSIIACSIVEKDHIIKWFKEFGAGYFYKRKLRPTRSLVSRIEDILNGRLELPRIFIVHGHDEKTKLEVKNFIQNRLRLGEPIVLHEQASLGRTIIEKYEEEAEDIDLVFVILTPDDSVNSSNDSNESKRRTRQNVIFELGYFYGKLKRRSGRVLLLYKGDLDLPSDISGIIYINIDDGVEHAGEDIRRELAGFV